MKTTPQDYINRELSWLDFNLRVLHEAEDKDNPLFERLKFLAITCSNLDEFFMVRVASLKRSAAVSDKVDFSGMTATQQLTAISEKTHDMVAKQYKLYSRRLLPLIEKENIRILESSQLSDTQKKFLKNMFREEIFPVLTPTAVDPSRPFPLIQNQTLNICAMVLNHDNEESFVTVQAPSVLPRLIKLPSKTGSDFILLERVIQMFMPELFYGYQVLCSYPYRIMRDADIPIDEDDTDDLLEEIEKNLKQRERSEVIRLEVEDGIDKKLLSYLKTELEVDKEDIYKIPGALDLTFLNKLYSEPFDKFKYPPAPSVVHPRLLDGDIFEEIKKNDILFHHPYDSFKSIVEFIEKSSKDPDVLAIKQTLYRVSGNSPIIKALANAADNGKQVTVLVELKARFDEENNIIWAKKLEKAGCHVIYGLLGLKTHSKITVVVRREEDGIRRYVHLGTGNYNDITAKFYTDMGILTCSGAIGADASAFFNMISGFCEPEHWNRLILAPLWLRKKTMEFIRQEIQHAKEGKPARIVAKVNSLVDPQIIDLLYQASEAGVKVDLIVRGICCLKAGVEGLSENITVRSIVGRYLEHTRIYYFYNDGVESVYLASADWMQRNLDHRVEIMFPILDDDLKKDVMHVIDVQLSDTMRSHVQKNGIYEKIDRRGKKLIDCQKQFYEEAKRRAEAAKEESEDDRVFIPMEHQKDE